MKKIASVLFALATLAGAATALRAETPEQWVALLTRVHGGFGSFLPVGIRIGEDAMKHDGDARSVRRRAGEVKAPLTSLPLNCHKTQLRCPRMSGFTLANR